MSAESYMAIWMKLIVPAGLLCGSVPAFLLYHDWVGVQSGWFDTILHFLADQLLARGIVYLLTIFFLMTRLAHAMVDDRRRTFIVALVWVAIGVGSIWLAANASDYLQATYNDDAYRRIDPDNFIALIGMGNGQDRSDLLILDNPSAFDSYTWAQLTFREVGFTTLIAIAAATMLSVAGKRLPRLGALAALALMEVLIGVYAKLVAPWAFIPDYDFFVGDRVLGSVAGAAFIFSPAFSDPVGGAVVFLYVISIFGMVIWWKPRGLRYDAPTATV